MNNNVETTLVSRTLKLAIVDGVNANGSSKTGSRSFTHINPLATAEQLKTAADAIEGLMDNAVTGVYDIKRDLLQETEDEENGGTV